MRTSSLSNLTRKQIAFHLIVAAALWLVWAPGTILGAQDAAAPTLESCFGVGKTVQGRLVGPETCRITRDIRIANFHGVAYRRIEMDISGSIDGYTVKAGPRIVNFTDVPELAMGQKGNLGPYFHGGGCLSLGQREWDDPLHSRIFRGLKRQAFRHCSRRHPTLSTRW